MNEVLANLLIYSLKLDGKVNLRLLFLVENQILVHVRHVGLKPDCQSFYLFIFICLLFL